MTILSTLRVIQNFKFPLLKKVISNKCITQTPWHKSFKNNPRPGNSNSSFTPRTHKNINDTGTTNSAKSSSPLKWLLFTGCFSGVTFFTVSAWHYENKLKFQNAFPSIWNEENKSGEVRRHMNLWWKNLHEGQKICLYICFLNVLVYGCWKVPALRGFMNQYFVSSPIAQAVCWPMVLSTFSHYSALHLGMNMYVLDSFCARMCDVLGKEQFVGFYLVAGLVSSLAGITLKMLSSRPNPSLGASGAILAMIGYFCTLYPNAKLNIVFLPQFSFSAENAILGIIFMDLLGVIFKWKLFDHGAHLGGALFGIFYCHFGGSLIWSHHDQAAEQWKSIKKIVQRD